MLAYILFVGFVVVFVTIAALGHVLVLAAIYPDLFGTRRTARQNAVAINPFVLQDQAAPPQAMQPDAKLTA